MEFLGENSKAVNESTVVAFDCDGTLWDYDRKPRHEVIDLFRAFKALGCRMVVWSGGGVDYAKQCARNLGLEPDAVIVKGSIQADISFDDMGMGPKETRVDVRV